MYYRVGPASLDDAIVRSLFNRDSCVCVCVCARKQLAVIVAPRHIGYVFCLYSVYDSPSRRYNRSQSSGFSPLVFVHLASDTPFGDASAPLQFGFSPRSVFFIYPPSFYGSHWRSSRHAFCSRRLNCIPFACVPCRQSRCRLRLLPRFRPLRRAGSQRFYDFRPDVSSVYRRSPFSHSFRATIDDLCRAVAVRHPFARIASFHLRAVPARTITITFHSRLFFFVSFR